jgi:Flp pilus assembly protein TadD
VNPFVIARGSDVRRPPVAQACSLPYRRLAVCAFSAISFLSPFSVPAALTNTAPTFTKSIAPIIFESCAPCHRPGQSGPFPLLTYADVKKRARQIAEVTERHYMPPWLPDGPKDEFQGDRRLSPERVALFRTWLESGVPEGSPEDLPSRPVWTEGWMLGEPDLVVEMPEKYILPAEGRDVYRNFVIPTHLKRPRYVRAVEFQPDNRAVVHHAFIKVDRAGQAGKTHASDGQPGFPGMNLPEGVEMPSGYFLSWQPGKTPAAEPPGFGWQLKPNQDLVLQVHLKPTGKPEELKARIGVYYTDSPPTNSTMTFALCALNLDIPPGVGAYSVENTLTLPVDVDVLSVLPHTHYLGKNLEGVAILPNGTKHQLLRIPDWDFNWQGDYRYSKPVHLPAGTTLQMRYTFDNSAANPRNPNQPPRTVRYGPQSTDEMAELWFQVRAQNTNDLSRLAQASNENHSRLFADYARFRLEQNPHDAQARTELGFTQWTQGKLTPAVENFRQAAADDPSLDQPHYYLGVILRTQNHLAEARQEFETAIKLNPRNSRAHGNLAFVFLSLGEIQSAKEHLQQALELNPADQLARSTLERIQQARSASPTSQP